MQIINCIIFFFKNILNMSRFINKVSHQKYMFCTCTVLDLYCTCQIYTKKILCCKFPCMKDDFLIYTHIKASRVWGVPHLTHGSWFFNYHCQTWFYNYQCQTFSRWHIISNFQFLSFLWWIKSKSSFAHLLINIQWRNHFEEF